MEHDGDLLKCLSIVLEVARKDPGILLLIALILALLIGQVMG